MPDTEYRGYLPVKWKMEVHRCSILCIKGDRVDRDYGVHRPGRISDR